MYTLVPRILSPIAKGIQAGHSWVRFMRKFPECSEMEQWADRDETVVILDGGTSNDGVKNDGTYIGTLNSYMMELEKAGIPYAEFYEPDINDSLTAVSFLADERVWDLGYYPEFHVWCGENNVESNNEDAYLQWLEMIGGSKNEFLKRFVFSKRLAS
jgi:hypothetical protein